MANSHYVVDNRTGGNLFGSEVTDGELEMVNAVMQNEHQVKSMLDQLEHRYDNDPELDKDRLQSLDIYKDGELYIEGTEYFTQQAGIADF